MTRLGTSTSLLKGHSSWNSIITQDDVAGIATMQWQAPPNWVVWMRRMRMRMRPDSWDVGQLEGRCDANILGPWHVRDTKTWSRRSGLPICMSKKMWNEKTQAAHAGNSLLMSSSNPRPSKKIAAKYPLIQKDPERLSWASLSQTKQSEITTIGQTSTNTTLVSCS